MPPVAPLSVYKLPGTGKSRGRKHVRGCHGGGGELEIKCSGDLFDEISLMTCGIRQRKWLYYLVNLIKKTTWRNTLDKGELHGI